MSRFATYCAALLLLILAGCQRENPVQLNDDELQSQEIEIQRSAVSIEPLDPALPDTAGLFLATEQKFYGKLIIASSEYDSPAEHHTVQLAGAIFSDRRRPVVLGGDTVAFAADDAGVVTIDNLAIPAQAAYSNLPGMPPDTIGVRYALVNVDGLGGRGFEYFGRHEYQWEIGGSASIPSFKTDVEAPDKIHVVSPPAGDELSRSRNVRFAWQGGGSVVTILISGIQEGAEAKPVLRLRVKNNNGRLLLPKRILQLLPADRTQFLFTFSSESSFVMTLYSSYRENISVRAVTSHSLVYSLTR